MSCHGHRSSVNQSGAYRIRTGSGLLCSGAPCTMHQSPVTRAEAPQVLPWDHCMIRLRPSHGPYASNIYLDVASRCLVLFGCWPAVRHELMLPKSVAIVSRGGWGTARVTWLLHIRLRSVVLPHSTSLHRRINKLFNGLFRRPNPLEPRSYLEHTPNRSDPYHLTYKRPTQLCVRKLVPYRHRSIGTFVALHSSKTHPISCTLHSKRLGRTTCYVLACFTRDG